MPLNAVFLINQYTLFRTYVRQLCWDKKNTFLKNNYFQEDVLLHPPLHAKSCPKEGELTSRITSSQLLIQFEAVFAHLVFRIYFL